MDNERLEESCNLLEMASFDCSLCSAAPTPVTVPTPLFYTVGTVVKRPESEVDHMPSSGAAKLQGTAH